MRSWKDIKFYHGYSYNDIKNTQKQWKEMEKIYNPVKRIRRTCIKILFIVLIIAICGFLLIHVESELDSLHETYSSLDGTENTNSKYSFKKSLEFVYKLAGKEVPISLHTDLGGKPVVDWEDIAPGEDDSTLDGGEDNMPSIGDDVSIDGWYTDLGNQPKGNVVETLLCATNHNVNVYRGLPWSTSGNAYFYDVVTAQGEISKNFKNAGVTFKNSSVIVNTANSGVAKERFYHTGRKIDGENVWGIGVTAPMLQRDYVDTDLFNSTAAKGDSSGKNWTYKLAVVLVLKGQDRTNMSNWYTIPASKIDAKVHTFPYGTFQTNVKLLGNRKAQISTNWSGTDGHWVNLDIPSSYNATQAIKYLNDYIIGDTTIQGLRREFDGKDATKFPGEKNFTMGSWGNHYLETYNTNSTFINHIKSKYDIVGYIVYE